MYYNYYNDSVNAIAGTVIWTIIALILAIIGGVLVYFLFIKGKDLKLSAGLQKLRDLLDFKIMLIEPILKILYLVITLFIMLSSFSLITVNFIGFLLMFILGPIVVRIIYEASIMLVMIWKNTKIIADNTAKENIEKNNKKETKSKEDKEN